MPTSQVHSSSKENLAGEISSKTILTGSGKKHAEWELKKIPNQRTTRMNNQKDYEPEGKKKKGGGGGIRMHRRQTDRQGRASLR